MKPLHCPKCGRFLSSYGSTGRANATSSWDINWGTCKSHGYQEWAS